MKESSPQPTLPLTLCSAISSCWCWQAAVKAALWHVLTRTGVMSIRMQCARIIAIIATFR
jgi:hypothetical protein